jgi:hypothetical protein
LNDRIELPYIHWRFLLSVPDADQVIWVWRHVDLYKFVKFAINTITLDYSILNIDNFSWNFKHIISE